MSESEKTRKLVSERTPQLEHPVSCCYHLTVHTQKWRYVPSSRSRVPLITEQEHSPFSLSHTQERLTLSHSGMSVSSHTLEISSVSTLPLTHTLWREISSAHSTSLTLSLSPLITSVCVELKGQGAISQGFWGMAAVRSGLATRVAMRKRQREIGRGRERNTRRV